MTAPTPEQLAAWRALTDAATPGEWAQRADRPRFVFVECSPAALVAAEAGVEADAAFIAAARTAMPRLLALAEEHEALRREVERQRTEAQALVDELLRVICGSDLVFGLAAESRKESHGAG